MSAAPGSRVAAEGQDDAPSDGQSATAASIIGTAGALAGEEGAADIGLRHLIAAAVSVGQGERTPLAKQWLFAAAFAAAVEAAIGAEAYRARRPAPALAPSVETFSPMAREVIEQAYVLARLATGERFIAARHLIIALTFPLRQPLAAALRRVWRARWGLDPETLRAPLATAMDDAIAARTAEGRAEDRAAWRSLFGARRDAPAFAADAPHPAATDPLGYAEEARRLAELATLRVNEPPMAVALFGDWGAGKSTFMRRMQAAVEDIGSTWREDAASPFCTRVAQVRFNAWTYADGDLWASLAAEIFRQLKREIARLSGEAAAPAQYRALLDRVALRLGAAEAAGREALGALAGINRALAEKREDLARVEARSAEITAAPAAERLRERAARLLAEDPAAVKAALSALGLLPADAAKQADALVGAAREATAVAGKARLALRLLPGVFGDWRVRIGLLGAVALLAFVHAAPGALAALASIALPLWARARPVLQAAAAFEAAEAQERAHLAARRTALEAEIADLRRQRAAKEADQTREAAFLARYAGAAGGESPAALLKFFLEQDVSLSDYEKRLGLVSRLRESFETLEALLAEGTRAADGRLPAIERIVLYVDDLDRCQPEQVVPVLQALALMLQLKLFVAVVAVDARWLNAALRIHYRALIENAAMTGPEQFLEKIFQIPYWLPRMDAGEAGRFDAFVAHLAPEAVAAPAAETAADAPAMPAAGGAPAADAIDPDELPQPDDADPFALAGKADQVARVSLSEPELRVLSALAPLAGATPRAVKRFVNLYRLIRASRQGAALDAWLGRGPETPEFPAFAFALACQNGLEPKALEDVRHWILDPDKEAPPGEEPITTIRQRYDHHELAEQAHPDAWRREAELRIAMAVRDLGGFADSLDDTSLVRSAWREAARFSFHRPG